MHALGRFAPEYAAVFGFGADSSEDYYLSLPSKRSLLAILISTALLAVFSYPLLTIGALMLLWPLKIVADLRSRVSQHSSQAGCT
ncbi:MAG: hypothetical protein COB20_04500 [SAR86 cluster bacterium]|uniref:Uncharacterized protein n=1 Tax=SAR86 cluster bacterium TaxID=2030880 RepID=A0A2A4XA87_9GAMM|nr:MAG: hypothetical protein COB20_04500 [SAR86 cluster bacterium]